MTFNDLLLILSLATIATVWFGLFLYFQAKHSGKKKK